MRIASICIIFRGDSENRCPGADFVLYELEKPLNATKWPLTQRISMRIPDSCTVFRGDSENRGPEADFQKMLG